jgi:hypothetical protein
MAGTRAKALAKMQAAHGYWRPPLSCSADKGQTAHGSDLHPPRSCMARKCNITTKAVKDVSGRKESSPQHS